jgi:WD40 repeat protein
MSGYLVTPLNAPQYSVSVFDAVTHELVASLREHTDEINCLTFSPDNRMLATGSSDKTVRLWNCETWELNDEVKTLPHPDVVDAVAFGNMNYQLTSRCYDNILRLWNCLNGEELLAINAGYISSNSGICFSLDNQKIITSVCANFKSVEGEKLLKVWSTKTGKCLKLLGRHYCNITGVALDPQGGHITSSSEDGSIVIWNLLRGGNERVLSNDWAVDRSKEAGFTRASFVCLCYSSDGGKLAGAVASVEDALHPFRVTIWETSTWSIIQAIELE